MASGRKKKEEQCWRGRGRMGAGAGGAAGRRWDANAYDKL